MNKQPLVSVITPLYNYEQYIVAAIESVLNQTYPHIEMIVVDDGSSDRGPEWVEAYQKHGVKLLRQARHGYGVARALNLAIENAQGEYISWLSADDYYLPHKIERNLEIFEAQKAIQPRLGLLHSRPGIESADPAYLREHCPLTPEEQQLQLAQQGTVRWSFERELKQDQNLLFFSLFHNPINGCTTFIPRTVFEKIGFFRNSWPVTQDYEMWLRILFAGYEVCYIPEILTISRFHAVNSGFYKTGLIGAETDLVMQTAKEYVDLCSPIQWQNMFPLQSIEKWPEYYTERMLADGLYAQALWELTRQGESLSSPTLRSQRQDLRALIQPLVMPPLPDSKTLTWGITLSKNTLKAPRLLAILTEFCAAFNSDDDVCLLLWADTDTQLTLPTLLSQWKAEISLHLRCRSEDLPQIIGLKVGQALLSTDSVRTPPHTHWNGVSLENALAQIQIYMPVGSPDPLEQRCIVSLRSQHRLIQWHADRADLKRMYRYHQGIKYWQLAWEPARLMRIQHKAEALFHERGSQSLIFYQDNWWKLDLNHPLRRTLSREKLRPPESTPMAEWAALPLPAEQYWPDWQAKASEPFQFEEVNKKIILSLYTPDNQTHWQESLKAFLNTGLNHPDFSLVIVAQTSATETDRVQEEVLSVLMASGIEPEQIENISIACLEQPDWSALFQASWLFVHPVSAPELWSPFWPMLRHGQAGILTLNWMSESLKAACWISPDDSVIALSAVLQQVLDSPELTTAKVQQFTQSQLFHTDRQSWLQQVFSAHFVPDKSPLRS